MSRSFSLAYLTTPGVEAMEQIRIAGESGYDCVSLRTIPMGQPGEPQLILEGNPQKQKEIRQQMERFGVRLLDIELVRIREDLRSDYRAAFEAGAELGATDVLSSVWTKDYSFAADRYGKICEQAAEFGLNVNMEFPIVSCMTTFDDTVAMKKRVGADNLKIFVDTLYGHFDKLTAEKIGSIPAEDYGIIHLCDCPVNSRDLELTYIVREGRAYCGEGEADLVSMLRALPDHPCSIELPHLANMAKYGAAGHAKNCLDAAKKLFAENNL